MRGLVKSDGRTLQAVLINLEASPEIDATPLDMLEQLWSELQESGIALYFARVSDEVRGLFDRSGFLERLGEGHIFAGVHSAVDGFLRAEQPALV